MNDIMKQFVQDKVKTLADNMAEDLSRANDPIIGRFMEGRVSVEEYQLDTLSDLLKIEDDQKAKSFIEEKRAYLTSDYNDDKSKVKHPIDGRYYSGRVVVEEHFIELLDEILKMFK